MAETAYKYDYGYNSNAATKPQREQQTKSAPKLDVYVNPLAKDIAREREVNKLAMKVSAVLAVALVVFSLFCFSCAEINDARHSLEKTKKTLVVHQTHNEELKSELNSLVASVDIDKYAVEKLGLIKVSAENEVYLTEKADNKVIYSAKE